MHETAFSFSQLEFPAPGASLPPGKHRLRGWVWPRPGGVFVDVRARVGPRIFPGIHGQPRADLAGHFNTGRPFALAGFEVAVELPPGPAAVALEVLDLEGSWSAFAAVSFAVDPTRPPVDFASPSGPLRWHEYGRALQALLRAQRQRPAEPLSALARELADSLPAPGHLRHPPLPFHGHLDEPAALTRSAFGRVPVLGFLFHETQVIRRVLATFDLQAWQTVAHTHPSPGPAAVFPQFPSASACGLYGLVDVPAPLAAPVSLRLYAELADGSLQLCAVQRSRLFTSEDEKAPYPPHSEATLAATHAALRAALAARGLAVVSDPALAAEFVRLAADFQLRAPRSLPEVPPLRPAPALSTVPGPHRVLLVTHNLNLEGAPLFLVDYARQLRALGTAVTVLSPADGPVGAQFTALGARVRLVDASAVFAASSAAVARAFFQALAQDPDLATADLVICNTFTTFWAVHAAKAAGRRVLLYVHESTTPAVFYADRVHPAIVALAVEAFGLADAVVFTTAATRRYHTDYGRPGNHYLAPGWVDVARIDAWQRQHPRDDLRARFDLKSTEWLVTNVGTVSNRKGQHIFARAVDLLWRRHPALAAQTRFVMLGGGATPFDALLGDLLGHLDRANLVVRPETPDYLPYFAAADLTVCSSFEESSPRVILEAMACAVPILSSDVHGVPELVRPGLEATLVPPGDSVALCEAMVKLLLSPAIGRELAARARARAVAQFDARLVLPRHAALAAAVAAGATP